MSVRVTADMMLSHVLEGPKGAPVVTLGNGIFADSRNWQQFAEALISRYRVLRFDFLGQGRSRPACAAVSPADQATALAGLLADLNLAPVHYLGVSYGGEVGLQWALDHPEQVRTLALADCVSQVGPELASRVAAWVDAARGGGGPLLAEVSLPDIFSPGYTCTHPEVLAAARRGIAELNLDSVLHLLEDYASFDLTARLGELNCPVLLLCGEGDTLKPAAEMAQLAAAIEGAEYLILPDAGHAAHMEQFEAFLTACLGFWTKREGN